MDQLELVLSTVQDYYRANKDRDFVHDEEIEIMLLPRVVLEGLPLEDAWVDINAEPF